MHISEGILTGQSMALTLVAGAAAVGWGLTRVNKLIDQAPERKPLLALAGAFIFLLSLTPFPAGPGTTTHPCGTPLAAIILGPGVTVVLAALSLFLQAAFFAHGGFSSLGANTLTLGLAGGLTGWLVYRTARKAGMSIFWSGALAGLLGDIVTYAAAGGILGAHLAFFGQTPQHDFAGYLKLIYGAYLPFQTPLAIGEAVLTGVIMRAIARQRPEVLESMGVEAKGFARKLLLIIGLCLLPLAAHAAFSGMDEVVNEEVAKAGGAPAHAPFLNLEAQGDLWNFMLLMGGGIAGFIIGRQSHHLFGKPGQLAPSKRKKKGKKA
jgi:cobalt/nickel transport system permease protein